MAGNLFLFHCVQSREITPTNDLPNLLVIAQLDAQILFNLFISL